MQTFHFQISAIKNRDRVRLMSLFALIEAQLKDRWIESTFNPQLVIADVDQVEGLAAVKLAISHSILTIGLSHQARSIAHYTLKCPPAAKDLLTTLNAAQDRLTRNISGQHPLMPAPPKPADPLMLRKSRNLIQYLSQSTSRGIVEVRFGLGRSIMFNHALESYCSVLPLSALLASAHLPIQEVAHGKGQAEAEWKLAGRVLNPKPIEDLAWQIAMANADTQPKDRVLQCKLHLMRLPHTSAGLSRVQLSMANALKRKVLSVFELANEVGTAANDAANFCYAAHMCKLIEFRT